VYCLGVTARGMTERVVGGVEGGHLERDGGSDSDTGTGTKEIRCWKDDILDEGSQDAEQSTVHHLLPT
jgi:hypothetical protein